MFFMDSITCCMYIFINYDVLDAWEWTIQTEIFVNRRFLRPFKFTVQVVEQTKLDQLGSRIIMKYFRFFRISNIHGFRFVLV